MVAAMKLMDIGVVQTTIVLHVHFRDVPVPFVLPGNQIGKLIYTPGTPCSRCPNGYQCKDALCSLTL
ncbi:hypothetical protein Q1695_010987 [Nippostrongylus brasiliensis]|nr:hypothetical protein Q1695_010987 [Nippostrongylus brasiliensis]